MIERQRLTGMRPGEVILIRTVDLDMGGDVWFYNPSRHKAAHHGQSRVVLIGPRGREVVRPWLNADPEAHLFSPAEAMEERRARRRASRKTRVQPSQRDRSRIRPEKAPGDRRTVGS